VDTIYSLPVSGDALIMIFNQIHLAMRLDHRQRPLLTEEQQRQDVDRFLASQRLRFTVLRDIAKLLDNNIPELQDLYKEAEGMMLYARGLHNG